MIKKLCKSRDDKVIAGVCGGIAEYFSTDPTIVRLVWGAAFFLGGTGFIAYIVAAIIMPKKEFNNYGDFHSNSHNDEFDYPNESVFEKDFSTKSYSAEFDEGNYRKGKSDKKVFGVILIVLGAFFLAKEFFAWINDELMIPFLLIAVGLVIIFGNRRKG